MSTWYDPQAGDERRAQLLRLQNLPAKLQWLRSPSLLYRTYGNETDPKSPVIWLMRHSPAYDDDPLADAHIAADAKLLWTWACRWHSGYEGYRHSLEGRKK